MPGAVGHRECSKTVPVWTPFPWLGGSLVILSWHTVLMPPVLMGTFHSCIILIHLSQVFYYIGKNLFGRVVEIIGHL